MHSPRENPQPTKTSATSATSAMSATRHGLVRLVILAALLCSTAGFLFYEQEIPVPEETIPRVDRTGDYVSSDTCKKCHPGAHASWHNTFHRTMTQVVSPETVVGDFDGKDYQVGDITYNFYRDGDLFMVDAKKKNTMGNVRSLPNFPRRVVMSTGSHHYQAYWVPNLKRQPIEIPLYYNIAEQRWIPKQKSVIEPPDTPGNSAHWNSHCINCHSTGGMPFFDEERMVADSRVADFGISCEACHGPGREHVKHHQNALNRYMQHLRGGPDPTIVNPEHCTTEVSVMICGRCHSSSQPIDLVSARKEGIQYRAGNDDLAEHLTFADFDNLDELEDYYGKDRPKIEGVETPTEGHTFSKVFWNDGTCRIGGDEYNAHIKSPCYLQGELTCLSCHSMHDSDPNDQLAAMMDTNEACLQCHSSYRDNLSAHTHHAADSSGSLCYNCHMPNTSYALSTAMRSHRIDSPDVQRSADTGRPDACNLCHLDKSLAWAGDYLSEWYGQSPPKLTAEQQELPASILWLLKGDAIQRAVTAWHFGWTPALTASDNTWQAPFLVQLLTDPYDQVRFIAHRALRAVPGYTPNEFPFDFLASDDAHQADQTTARTKWQAENPPGSEAAERIIELIGNEPLNAFLERMSAARDDTAVEIPE
ncbi:MAG: hypothetical protein CBB70_15370 [Planctomycetaceae bacterium TMED10]|nr:MAG: hypothetical protein CBB70_15370 [Planctomycetaceae bacterium TMED10]